jgi:hypothetical protein
MEPPHDYLERVYAVVLGKLIGVYLGRPFEQWSHERILSERRAAGIGARVQGMRRFYGLLLCADGMVRLTNALDGDTVLAEGDFGCAYNHNYQLALEVCGASARVDR